MRKDVAKGNQLFASGFLILLLLLIISSRLYAQDCDDWKARGYKGRIETVRVYLVMGGRGGQLRIEEISYQIIKYYPGRKSGK